MAVTTLDRVSIHGHVSRGFEGVREAFVENFTGRRELGGACCVVPPRRESRRSLGRRPQQADRRAVGTGHHGAGLLGDQGTGGDDAGARALARLARLRGAGLQLLAGVRAAGQGAHHRPPAPGAPGGPLRLRRAGRSRSRRRPRSTGRSSWRARSPRGSPGHGRRITPSRLGFYEGELLRRVDPRHRSLGQFFQDEIASPLGLEVYIRLPESIPNSQAGDAGAARTARDARAASRSG